MGIKTMNNHVTTRRSQAPVESRWTDPLPVALAAQVDPSDGDQRDRHNHGVGHVGPVVADALAEGISPEPDCASDRLSSEVQDLGHLARLAAGSQPRK